MAGCDARRRQSRIAAGGRMIKSIALVHLVLWGGLVIGGLFRLPEQFHKLIVHRTEVPANVSD
jgi:hypothetical protein